MNQLGFLIIATNRYLSYVESLIRSMQEFVVVENTQLKFFVFTDRKKVCQPAIRLAVPHKPWPNSTLMRYHFFLEHREQLEQCSHLFYCDADMRFVGRVGSEIVHTRVATLHPGYYEKPADRFTYERRPESKAYIPCGVGEHYYCGGVQGGETKAYLEMSETISQWVDEDQKKGIIAIWHDESYYNRYLLNNPPTKTLSPSYCYPESWTLPYEKRILALDKDHNKMRGIGSPFNLKRRVRLVTTRLAKLLRLCLD